MRAMDATWWFKEMRRPRVSKATCSFIRGVFQRCILGGTTLDTLSSGISQEFPFSGRCFRSIQRMRCVVSSKYPWTYLFPNLPCKPPIPSNSKSASPYVAHCTSPSTRRGLPEVESSTASKIIAMQCRARSRFPRRCAWLRLESGSSRRRILDQNVVLIGKLFPVNVWVRNGRSSQSRSIWKSSNPRFRSTRRQPTSSAAPVFSSLHRRVKLRSILLIWRVRAEVLLPSF